MDSLRQKIEGLREPERAEKEGDYVWLGARDYNEAIDDVLEILDQAMAEKDAPDSAGIWIKVTILLNGKRLYSLYDVTHDGVSYFVRSTTGYEDDWERIDKVKPKGKWIKAIMPEPKRIETCLNS